MDMQKELIKAIDERIRIAIDDMRFDKTYYGIVKSSIGSTSVVMIDGYDYTARIRDGLELVNGDVVLVKSPNNNFSGLYIDGKLKR